MKLADIILEDFSVSTDADEATERLIDLMLQAYNNGEEPPYDPVRYERDRVHIRVPYRDRTSNDAKKQLDVITTHLGERIRPDRTNAYVYVVTTTNDLAKWKRNLYPSSEEEWQSVRDEMPTALALSNKETWKQGPDEMANHVADVERAEKAAEAGRKRAKDIWTPGTELYKQRQEHEERWRNESQARMGLYGPPRSLLQSMLAAKERREASIGPQLSKQARKRREKKYGSQQDQ